MRHVPVTLSYPLVADALRIDTTVTRGRYLHLGCTHPGFVQYLRQLQIQADGFVVAPIEDRGTFFGLGNDGLFLPRADATYDVVFGYDDPSNGKSVFYYRIGERAYHRGPSLMVADVVSKSLAETFRVLKPNGRLVFWPEPEFLSFVEPCLEKYSITVDRYLDMSVIEYQPKNPSLSHSVELSFNHRP